MDGVVAKAEEAVHWRGGGGGNSLRWDGGQKWVVGLKGGGVRAVNTNKQLQLCGDGCNSVSC